MNKITLQIPDSLLATARKLADGCGLGVEEYLSRIMIKALQRDWWEERTAQGAHITRERFLEVLRKAPDAPPMPGDEIEP